MSDVAEELKKTQTELDNLRGEMDAMYEKMAEVTPEMKEQIAAIKEKVATEKQERNDLVKKCHPNDDHWPPHEDCPVCQKLLGRVENIAKERCKNPDDENELGEKFVEVFNELYAKKNEEPKE